MNGIALQGNALPDIDVTSWKVFAGFRPIRPFAVEADYLDLGSATVEGACYESCCMEACRGLAESFAHAFAAYAVGFLPIPVPFLDIYGKVGFDRWHLNGQSLSFMRVSDDGTSFARPCTRIHSSGSNSASCSAE